MSSLKLAGLTGLVFVTGEKHTKGVEEIVTPAHVLKTYKPGLRGALQPRWVAKNMPEKRKHVSVKRVEYFTVQCPAGEAVCTATRIGYAFALACRMLEDGLTNVRIWNHDGSILIPISKADLKKRDKALAHSMRLVKVESRQPEPIAA